MSKTITFCKAKCCPVVEIYENEIKLGDEKGPERRNNLVKKTI